MIREAVELYGWIWRQLLGQRNGAVIPAAGAFAGVVTTDLLRALALTLARVSTDLRRTAVGITGRQIASGVGQATAAAGFCFLLFAPLGFAFLASQRPGPVTAREGEIRVVAAGFVLLDDVPIVAEALGAQLAARGLRSVRVSVGSETPVAALAALRAALAEAEVERVWMHTAPGRPGAVR